MATVQTCSVPQLSDDLEPVGAALSGDEVVVDDPRDGDGVDESGGEANESRDGVGEVDEYDSVGEGPEALMTPDGTCRRGSSPPLGNCIQTHTYVHNEH